ncbi:MAG: metallophosphoesterase [Phycisphaerae bacterium]|nr:metallophosphoesterase [Phycisphaerae bacterium]
MTLDANLYFTDMTAKEIIGLLNAATQANLNDRWRSGNMISLHGPGDVLMTGDLHGNEVNFDKIVRCAQLESNPNRHLILHELLHCSESDFPDQCHSYMLVAKAARLKARFPDQVHYLMGNHAMCQVIQDEVLKAGKPMVRAFNTGLQVKFGQNDQQVAEALDKFILSMPLATRTANKIWLSHTLPNSRHLKDFEDEIFNRPITLKMMESCPSMRAFIWDRRHNAECIEKLCQRWDVEMFIIGHQPQPQGCGRPVDRMIILASDHPHGCFLPFNLDTPYQPDELFNQVKPLAAIR